MARKLLHRGENTNALLKQQSGHMYLVVILIVQSIFMESKIVYIPSKIYIPRIKFFKYVITNQLHWLCSLEFNHRYGITTHGNNKNYIICKAV